MSKPDWGKIIAALEARLAAEPSPHQRKNLLESLANARKYAAPKTSVKVAAPAKTAAEIHLERVRTLPQVEVDRLDYRDRLVVAVERFGNWGMALTHTRAPLDARASAVSETEVTEELLRRGSAILH
ncbi:MAG TPA: hypothetical protein VFU97_24395 [Xanthobacteraceae bacterium]|nr:hypothetical protein [Xanthobacteraceae bacterium]